MQIWNEMTQEMYFSRNDNYLGISSRKVTLSYAQDSEQIVSLQATLPFWIQPTTADGTPIGEPISSVGLNFTNDFFKLTIQQQSGGSDNIYQLSITALQDNRTDNSFLGYFQVYTDFWTFDVEVEQETYMDLYANRIIRVLTINSLPGDLGTADGNFTDGVSGDAMRRVLENKSNFSPSGTIPILWVTEGTDVDARMTHGINPSLGVFYCGESEITSSRGNGMSAQAAASGTITSDLDILMSNIWVWIVERVVEGEIK